MINDPRLTTDLKISIRTALRLLSGGISFDLASGDAELIFQGQSRVMTNSTMTIARALAERMKAEFLIPNGYQPPFDNEAILIIEDKLEELVYQSFIENRLRVCFIVEGQDATTYWRVEEPVRVLNQLFGNRLLVEYINQVDPSTIFNYDIYVAQRGIYGDKTNYYHSLLQRLKLAGKVIVYEADDDYETLNPDNNALKFFTPETRALIDWLKRESHAIFTTTKQLSQVLGHPHKTFVLPNSIDFSRLREASQTEGRENIIHVVWAGGLSHDVDFNWWETEIRQMMISKREQWQKKVGKKIIYGFMGYFPEFLRDLLKQSIAHNVGKKGGVEGYSISPLHNSYLKFYDGVKVGQFHQAFIDLQPDICLCPLNPKVPFNLSKSNIKFIEATAAGATCVVTDVGPYATIPDECVIKASTGAQMVEGVQTLIYNEEKRKTLFQKSDRYVRNVFDLKDNASLWLDAFMLLKNGEKSASADYSM